MKKTILLFLLLSAIFASASAQADTDASQTTSTSLVVRQGNHYMVGNQLMDKKAFQGFLESQEAVSYSYFRKGRILSKVGWGLLGGGLGMVAIGAPLMAFYGNELATKNYKTKNTKIYVTEVSEDGKAVTKTYNMKELPAEVVGMAMGWTIGYTLTYGGSTFTIASIPCLAVGYHHMHKAVDIYNQTVTNRSKQQAVALFSLQSSSDGIGFALSF